MIPIIKMTFDDVIAMMNCSIEEARESAIVVGGFCAIEITDKTVEQYYSLIGKERTDTLFCNGPGNYVMYSSSLAEEMGMSDAEVAAILSHEEGHIVLGHLSEKLVPNKYGILLHEQNEIEADRYAARIHGVDVVCSALEKITKYMDFHKHRVNTENRINILRITGGNTCS